jgi:hypothetical protein
VRGIFPELAASSTKWLLRVEEKLEKQAWSFVSKMAAGYERRKYGTVFFLS